LNIYQKEKSWDLCLTDPPYSVNAKGNNQKKKAESISKIHYDTIEKIDYIDNMNWTTKINTMENCFRVSNFCLFTSGIKEMGDWFRYKQPTDILYWFKANCFGKTSHFCNINTEPIFCYGQIDDQFPFRSNTIRVRLENGFLRDNNLFIHSTPKEPLFYKAIIKNYTKTLKSIIDPFLGSGTTAQVCEEMGIPWLGYEIMEAYAPDIDKRIQLGMKAHESYVKLKKKQKVLFE